MWTGRPRRIPAALQIREFAREEEQTVEIFLDRDIPHNYDVWFEHAINCCAFLAWRLSNNGASIHFRSQGYEFRQPEDGDIYTILKYLALVYPQRALVESPLETTSYKVVFTPSPRQFAEAGWHRHVCWTRRRCPLPRAKNRHPARKGTNRRRLLKRPLARRVHVEP